MAQASLLPLLWQVMRPVQGTHCLCKMLIMYVGKRKLAGIVKKRATFFRLLFIIY